MPELLKLCLSSIRIGSSTRFCMIPSCCSKATENTSTVARIAYLTLSGSGVADQVITVKQDKGGMELNTSDRSLRLSSAEHSMSSFEITSNTSWELSSPQAWLDISPGSGSGNAVITLTVSENSSFEAREADINITGVDIAHSKVHVIQSGRAQWHQVINGLKSIYPQVIAVDPLTGSLYMGTLEYGLFVSENDGETWTEANTGLSSLNVSAFAFRGDKVYAGTRGGGVHVSTDQGNTWTTLNTGLSGESLKITCLVNNGSELLAGTDGGGVCLMSAEETWTQINNGLRTGRPLTDIEISNANADLMLRVLLIP